MARPADQNDRGATAWLARYFLGPASVGDPTTPIRPATAQERARDDQLHDSFERVVDAEGRTYLVERSN